MFEVMKRDGRIEKFNPIKIEKVVNTCKDSLDLSLDNFYNKFQIGLKSGIKTSEIQRTLINTAISMIQSEKNKRNWSIFANRLILVDFKKQMKVDREFKYKVPVNKFGVFEKFEDYIQHLQKYVKKGIYSEKLLSIPKDVLEVTYNKIFIENWINPLWNIKHMQTQKFINTYLVEVNNKPIEIPEEVWYLQSLLGFLPSYEQYLISKEEYINKVLEFYDHLSNFRIIPATPQMLNLRKSNGNLSSCFITNVDDSTESITEVAKIVTEISRNGGGVGLDLTLLRPSASAIRNNFGKANPIVAWMKLYEVIIRVFNQLGKRAGSLTPALKIWHKDSLTFLDAINLDISSDPTMTPKDLNIQVVIPGIFWKYHNQRKPWYVYDRHEIVDILEHKDLDLYEAITDEEYERILKDLEKLIEENKLKNYRKLKTTEVLKKIMYYFSRKGLPYLVFEDNVNKYSSFTEKIQCTNLCVENFSPFDIRKEMIHTCNITNVNILQLAKDGYFEDDNKLKNFIFLLYEYMDNLLDITTNPVEQSRNHNQYYRTVSAGFLGLADMFVYYSLKDNKYYGYKYKTRARDDSTLDLIDRTIGKFAIYAVYASILLAKDRNPCLAYVEGKTKYHKNIILGRYNLGDLTEPTNDYFKLHEKFGNIIEDISSNLKEYGIRNSMLLNCPPNTSTSILAGVSAGVMPQYSDIHIEDQQTGLFVNFVEYYDNLLLYDIYTTNFTNMQDYESLINVIAQIQKWIDSGISFELVVNHNYFKSSEELTILYLNIIKLSHKLGIKALYYWRHIIDDIDVSSGQKVECESCSN